MNGTPDTSLTLKIVPLVRLLSIENSCPEDPSKDKELSLKTFNDIGEFPELKKFNVNVEDPIFPNVPELNTKAPETPNPPPILVFPLTPSPPVTIKAPEVEDVELVLCNIETDELLYWKFAAPSTVEPVPI
jgi:hypothetical protein